VRYLHIQHDSMLEVTNTHTLHRIMKIIRRTRHIIYHTKPYGHFSAFPGPQINTCQRRSTHFTPQIWTYNPDRNGFYHKLLPYIRAALRVK
jgi:hypothetical protein